MKRMPFKMKPSRYAQTRYVSPDGREQQMNARASYVWLWSVLVPLACGTATSVEIRETGLRKGPWHLIDYTSDEAYALIVEHYNPGTKRLVDSHRRKRGLSVR